MRRVLVVLLAMWACTATAQVRRAMTPADAFALRDVGEVRISPDAGTVVFSVTTTDPLANVTSTRVMRVPAKGGAPTELEGMPEGAEVLRWSPDSRRLAFFATRDGRRAVWIYELASGELTRVCDYDRGDAVLPDSGNLLSWSPDGSRLAFAGTLDARSTPDNRRTHIYAVAATGRGLTPVTSGDSDDHSLDWGGDGAEIVFLSNRRKDSAVANHDDIFAVSVGSGRVRRLTDTPGAEKEPRVSPDGQWIAYVAEDAHVFAMPIGGASAKVDSGGARELNHALDRRSSAPEWAPDGRAIIYMAFDRGKSVLYRVSLQGGASVALIDRKAHVGQFSMARDGLVAAGISDPLTPPEVYRFRPDADLQPLTTLNSATTAPLQLVTPEPIAFRGADVAAWYYPAAGTARPAPASIPLILSIQNGRHGVRGYRFNAAVQVQAGRGYATLVVRPRGSGDGDSEDVMAGVDQLLKSKPEIDVERVGVTGPRESGVMHEIATQATRFKAIVSIAADPDDRPAAPASDLTIPTLVVHDVHDPAHDLDRMERTLAWFDRFLGSRPSASR